jgi:hypothetical protein
MKTIWFLPVAVMVSLLVGCSTTPVAVAPVGPNPAGIQSTASNKGGLEVFSQMRGHSEGDNPMWFQHTDYAIYSPDGKLLKRVNNKVGYYAQAPRLVVLPAGQYIVKAQSKDYLRVQVPVTIQPGRTTRVHLDDNWNLPAGAAKDELVSMPDGHAVGWRSGS